MPSVFIHPALWDRLSVLAAKSDRTVEELIDELLSDFVIEGESLK